MARYHVNPETQKAGVCKAQSPERCRFFDRTNNTSVPHFDSKEEAEQHIAEKLASEEKEVTSISKTDVPNGNNSEDWIAFLTNYTEEHKDEAQGSSEESVESEKNDTSQSQESDAEDNNGDTKGGREYVIYQDSEQTAVDLIERANKRLERSGFKGKFDYTINHFTREERDEQGFKEYHEMSSVTVYPPEVEHNGYKFLASVSKEEGGLIVRAPKGGSEELDGWRPDTSYCDHCGKKRERNTTYLVKTPDGKVQQIGSSCVKGYLGGVTPAGLWSLNYDVIGEEKLSDANSDYHRGNSAAIDSKEYIALALAVSDNGESFKSKKYAENYGGFTTAELVEQVKSGGKMFSHEEYKRILADTKKYLDNGRAEEVINSAKNIDQSTDYGKNMAVIANSDHIKYKNVNFLASAIAVNNRERKEKIKNDAMKSGQHIPDKGEEKTGIKYTPGFMGAVGEKVKDKKLKIISNDVREKYDYFGERVNYSILKLRDENGQDATVFANRVFDEEPGETLDVSSATIKEHNTFKDKESTILKNMRVRKKKSS